MQIFVSSRMFLIVAATCAAAGAVDLSAIEVICNASNYVGLIREGHLWKASTGLCQYVAALDVFCKGRSYGPVGQRTWLVYQAPCPKALAEQDYKCLGETDAFYTGFTEAPVGGVCNGTIFATVTCHHPHVSPDSPTPPRTVFNEGAVTEDCTGLNWGMLGGAK